VPAPQLDGGGVGIPAVDLDVRVDQATSVASEVRFEVSLLGSSTSVLLAISNPGEPFQIVPPAPALVDDAPGAGAVIIGTEGSRVETPVPDVPEKSPASP
jgi:hypothetical protein